MGLIDTTQIALEQALAGAAQRQQVLANNIANANTAGFKRSDIDFQSTLSQALGQGASADQIASIRFTPQSDTSTAIKADGNNVDIDQENAALAQNTITYEAIVAVAKARLQMIQTALGSGR
jgi:flagellar basal-body rod protein FlgB